MVTNKANKSGFATIRTYAELESSLRMVRRMQAARPLSRRVDRFMTGSGIGQKAVDVALLVCRIAQRYILKSKRV